MHSIKQPPLEDFYNAKTQASPHHITRSIPGMKSLLPLRLSSPSPSETDAWPAPAINNRSTFGMNIALKDGNEDRISQYLLGNRQNSDSGSGPYRLNPYRDIPIYTEPGSPQLSRAYFTDDELHSSCATSESDEWFEASDCSCIRAGVSECVEGSCRTEVMITLYVPKILPALM
jgi:hypothetical protein